MATPKRSNVPAESTNWREVAINYVPNLDIPVTPSAFAEGAAKVCNHGLEEICLASSVVTSG